jgi:hypothetical protein
MAIQTVNIGNQVNDGLGDDLRSAFQKVNANFTELNASLTVTASNLGGTGSSVFKQKTGANLEFRKLVSGTKMLLDEAESSIVINNTAPDAFTRFDTDYGQVSASTHQVITLQGNYASGSETLVKDIEVSVLGSTVRFATVIPVTEILTTFDFGFISSNIENVAQLALAAANVDFGTTIYPSRLDLNLGGIL